MSLSASTAGRVGPGDVRLACRKPSLSKASLPKTSLPGLPAGAALATLLLLLSLLAPTALGQEARGDLETFSDQAQVTAVDLVIDVRDEDGNVPADLQPADFTVLEDGEAKRVVAVERFADERTSVSDLEISTPAPRAVDPEIPAWSWNLVVYVDQTLSGSGSIRRATHALAARAGDLTRLGTVEIVAANPHPRTILPATRSARLVEQALLKAGNELGGMDAVNRLRKRFLDTLRSEAQISGTGVGSDRGAPGPPPRRGGAGDGQAPPEGPVDSFDGPGGRSRMGQYNLPVKAFTQETVMIENRLLKKQEDRMLTWAADYLEKGPRALLLVNDGYDIDARDFYLTGIEELRDREQLNSILQAFSPISRYQQLVKVMAARGWVCMNLALGGPPSTYATVGAENDGQGYLGNISGRDRQGQGARPAQQTAFRPLDGLRNLAEETGGELITGRDKIPSAVERLGERVRLTYQVARLPDGEIHPVEVRARRPGWTVNAPQWSGSPAPEAVSSARARRLLEDNVESGDLPVAAAVGIAKQGELLTGRSKGTLQARLDLSQINPEALPATTNLRVTFAIELEEQLPFVQTDLVEGQRLRGIDAWTYTVPVSFPPEVEKVSVVVEELATGAWGGAVASQVEGALPEIPEGRHTASMVRGGADRESRVVEGYDLPVDLLPDAKALVLIPPPGEMITGSARFETLVTRPDVERVEFLLDGQRVGTVRHSPFHAKLDLGELPRARTVEAVAYSAEGEELGRDSVVVNEGSGSFRVRLIEPRRSDLSGPVAVEADVRVPADAEIERVEIAWNDERVATLYAPPFRQRVMVPPEAPVGYIGVTAHLADGSTAEDVIFMNGPGGDERVEVKLVELYTVVGDADGRPVRGLGKADFRVFEEGRRQELADLKDGSELPLSLGLLLDSSASMADDLRQAQIAAIDFLFLTLDVDDQAFVVDFDSEPRLIQPMTGDLAAAGRQLVRPQAGGYTALCDALVYSLVQMQAVRGRRALVVLSDGAGREERVSYATCLRLAQQVGVPIYAVVLDRDGSERERSRRVEKVADAVGGRVFYVADLANLGGVYRQIREELESQYVLSYYPPEGGAENGGDGFRRVEVEAEPGGLTARTVSGYWP